MVAVAVRSSVVPQDWWIVERTPPPESFGQAIKRLRLEMGARLGRPVDQNEVRRAVGVSQSSMSDYENGKTVPDLPIIHRFNDYFHLRSNELRDIARSYEDWEDEQARHPLPGPSVAIPNDPKLIEAVEALYLLETEQLPTATESILLLAEGRPPGYARDEEPVG